MFGDCLVFFVTASNKKHEPVKKIHIRLLTTGVFHGLCISSALVSNP